MSALLAQALSEAKTELEAQKGKYSQAELQNKRALNVFEADALKAANEIDQIDADVKLDVEELQRSVHDRIAEREAEALKIRDEKMEKVPAPPPRRMIIAPIPALFFGAPKRCLEAHAGLTGHRPNGSNPGTGTGTPRGPAVLPMVRCGAGHRRDITSQGVAGLKAATVFGWCLVSPWGWKGP